MRNTERIPKLLRLIHEIWSKYPDTRFNQLIHSLQAEYANEKNSYRDELWEKDEYRGIVSYRKTSRTDLFYVEDEDFMKFLQEKLDSYQK